MHDKSMPGVMKVNGFDVEIGVESVLVEENRASSVMGHVEPTSKNLMVDILRCLLEPDAENRQKIGNRCC